MAMDIGGARGGIKGDINVTPLVDVMLVLLIIMMIVAPMLQKGVDLTLPTAAHTVEKPDTADQTVVYVDAERRLYVNTVPVAAGDVVPRIQTALEQVADKTVYLKGDKDVPYGAIMDMMDALRQAGIETVGLIAEPPADADAVEGGA